jgi:hypothetical protein
MPGPYEERKKERKKEGRTKTIGRRNERTIHN